MAPTNLEAGHLDEPCAVDVIRSVMVKMDPPKLVPPGTNFSINKDPPELILLQNMDSL